MESRNFKQKLLEQLYAPYRKCIECPLGTQGRKNVVFGEGNPEAKIVFIGEGPGQDEDEQDRPFVGRSGKLLNSVFEIVGIQRSDIFITNIVKCRPPSNRKPTPEESMQCKKLLLSKQLKIIRPQLICTLGASAIQGLLNDYTLKITKIRGLHLMFENVPVIPTYHPAYILRNPKELQTLVKDMQSVADFLTLK